MLLRVEGRRLIGLLTAVGIAGVLAGARAGPGGPPDAPIDRLSTRLARGQVAFAFDSARGWLPSLLDALEVPVDPEGPARF